MAVAFARLGISNGSFSFLSVRGEWPPSIFAGDGSGSPASLRDFGKQTLREIQ